jgi:hypothetical protein
MLLLLPLLVVSVADAKPKAKPKLKETPHVEVVAEFIRSLGAVHAIQRTSVADKEAAGDDARASVMDSIRNLTRLKLELKSSAGMLNSMKLKEPYEWMLPDLAKMYKQKIELFDEMIKISRELLTDTPKPGVDYAKLASRTPEITATVDYIDESIFKMTPAVFALLIHEKPDSEGHMSHLNITSAQRQKLIDSINNLFSDSLGSKNNNWTATAALLLKDYLEKDFIPLDEWQTAASGVK